MFLELAAVFALGQGVLEVITQVHLFGFLFIYCGQFLFWMWIFFFFVHLAKCVFVTCHADLLPATHLQSKRKFSYSRIRVLKRNKIHKLPPRQHVACYCVGAGRKTFCIHQIETEGIGLQRTLLSAGTADQLEKCWWSNSHSSWTVYPLKQFYGLLALNNFKWLTDLIWDH